MPHATKNRFILSATFHLWQSQYYHFAFLTSPWHYRTHLWFLLWDARSDSLPFLLIWMLTLWGTMWCGLRLSMRGESFFLSPKIYLEAINICFEIGLCQFMGWVLMFTRQILQAHNCKGTESKQCYKKTKPVVNNWSMEKSECVWHGRGWKRVHWKGSSRWKGRHFQCWNGCPIKTRAQIGAGGRDRTESLFSVCQ